MRLLWLDCYDSQNWLSIDVIYADWHRSGLPTTQNLSIGLLNEINNLSYVGGLLFILPMKRYISCITQNDVWYYCKCVNLVCLSCKETTIFLLDIPPVNCVISCIVTNICKLFKNIYTPIYQIWFQSEVYKNKNT